MNDELTISYTSGSTSTGLLTRGGTEIQLPFVRYTNGEIFIEFLRIRTYILTLKALFEKSRNTCFGFMANNSSFLSAMHLPENANILPIDIIISGDYEHFIDTPRVYFEKNNFEIHIRYQGVGFIEELSKMREDQKCYAVCNEGKVLFWLTIPYEANIEKMSLKHLKKM